MPALRTTDHDVKYTVLPSARGHAPLDEGTYFVIRNTDLFAPAILYSYVNIIQTQLELAHQRPGFLTEEEVGYLRDLERYVLDLAQEWQRQGVGRLPD